MADQPKKRPAAAEGEKKRSKAWLWIVLGAIVFLVLNVGITFYLTNRLVSNQSAKTASAMPRARSYVAPVNTRVKATLKSNKGAIFYALDKPFVVNINGRVRSRFLQVKVEVMTHYPAVVDAIKTYSPVIRNNLLLLYSAQSYKGLNSRDAKENLLLKTKMAINKVLRNKIGMAGVDHVYFTSFVMQ